MKEYEIYKMRIYIVEDKDKLFGQDCVSLYSKSLSLLYGSEPITKSYCNFLAEGVIEVVEEEEGDGEEKEKEEGPGKRFIYMELHRDFVI